MTNQDEDPRKARFRRDLEALALSLANQAMTESIVDQLDHGHELPFGADVIRIAAANVPYRMAADQAAADGHRVTAWMIRRLIRIPRAPR